MKNEITKSSDLELSDATKNEITTFAELELSDALLKALKAKQFITPSPIQQQTIPWLLQGRDIIGLAKTGTGKTAAFGLPILQRLTSTQRDVQALILAPTRELAIQVATHIEELAAHQSNTRVVVLCGGQDYRPQLKKLREGAHIVVGTPGRILDHIERGTLKLTALNTLVLDEADEMLRMGFIEDVETILAQLPDKKQIALFSATMPSRIRQIASKYLNDPVSIEIKSNTATVESIAQRFVFVSPQQKPDALVRILATEDHQGVIVFVRTKTSTEDVAESLQHQGYRAMPIHGDITQALRERVIAQFKSGAIDILVATDVAARGLDVDRVTHVINYDMAHDCETYVHRIGRTGRAGRSGITILFVSPREARTLSMIERHTRQPIEKIQVPNDAVIQAARDERLMHQITTRLESKHLADYRQIVETYLERHSDIDAVDVAAALALLAHQDKPWRKNLPPFQAQRIEKEGRVREQRRQGNHPSSGGTRRPSHFGDHHPEQQELFRLDVGRVHGVKPGNIVGAIANEAGLQSRFITGLKIHDEHSTVRLPRGMSKDIVRGLQKAWVCGRQLNLTSMEHRSHS